MLPFPRDAFAYFLSLAKGQTPWAITTVLTNLSVITAWAASMFPSVGPGVGHSDHFHTAKAAVMTAPEDVKMVQDLHQALANNQQALGPFSSGILALLQKLLDAIIHSKPTP